MRKHFQAPILTHTRVFPIINNANAAQIEISPHTHTHTPTHTLIPALRYKALSQHTQRNPYLAAQHGPLTRKNHTHAHMLDLTDNDIYDECAQDIADALKNNTVLTTLDLAGNRIRDEGSTLRTR